MRKSNDSCIKMVPHKPKIEKPLNQISTGITRVRNKPSWISKIDLEYAYCRLILFEETSRLCNFAKTGENANGEYRFSKNFYSLSDISTIFQEKIDRNLNYQTPMRLEDILIVTRGKRKDTIKSS